MRSGSGYAAMWVAGVAMLLTASVRTAEASRTALDREPCVTMVFRATQQTDPTGHREYVYATAKFRDGREAGAMFPYVWTYADPARQSPFFGTNTFQSDVPLRIQRVPRALDPRTVSPVIAYILEHTDPGGRYHGRPCPPWSIPDRTFFERVSEGLIPRRVHHAADDGLVAEIAPVSDHGVISVCALAVNIGPKPVRRVRLRWDLKLRSETVTTPRDWDVSLAPSDVPRERAALSDALAAMASRGVMSCAAITNDPRLSKKIDDVEQISLTVLAVERAP